MQTPEAYLLGELPAGHLFSSGMQTPAAYWLGELPEGQPPGGALSSHLSPVNFTSISLQLATPFALQQPSTLPDTEQPPGKQVVLELPIMRPRALGDLEP